MTGVTGHFGVAGHFGVTGHVGVAGPADGGQVSVIGTEGGQVMQDTQNVPVQIETRGSVAQDMTVLATGKVLSLMRLADRPVRLVRVMLTMAANPANERPAVVRVSVDIDGRAVRAQADGATMRDAIGHMADRLRRRLERTTRNWETRRGSMPTGTVGQWRHRSIPVPHPPRPGTTG